MYDRTKQKCVTQENGNSNDGVAAPVASNVTEGLETWRNEECERSQRK